jgi:hypothetical protein
MDFRAQLDAINSGRSQLAQNKSIAKLDVLRELRSRAQQIEDQTRQMTMQFKNKCYYGTTTNTGGDS